MSLTYSRRREITAAMESKEEAAGYLDRLENTVRMIYDGNAGYEKLCDAIRLVEKILEVYMESVLYTELDSRIELFKRAQVIRSAMTEVPDDTHRQRQYAPGAVLQLEVEEEKDYTITPHGSTTTPGTESGLIIEGE